VAHSPAKAGHKKTGLNNGSAGITHVPGLFIELFKRGCKPAGSNDHGTGKMLVPSGPVVKVLAVNQSWPPAANNRRENVFFAFGADIT